MDKLWYIVNNIGGCAYKEYSEYTYEWPENFHGFHIRWIFEFRVSRKESIWNNCEISVWVLKICFSYVYKTAWERLEGVILILNIKGSCLIALRQLS